MNARRRKSPEKFDGESLAEFRRSLLQQKGGRQQRDFLESARDSEAFCAYVRERVGILEGENLPLLRKKLTESSFQRMSLDTEREIFSLYRSVDMADARCESFWGLASFRHIQEGLVEPHFLAARNQLSGKECIERALSGANRDKELDQVVRTVLRRFCGLRETRGFRSLYMECVLARAWWRTRFCEEACGNSGADPDKVGNLLHASQVHWENLVQCAIYENWELSELKPLYALVWSLSELLDEDQRPRHISAQELRTLLQLMQFPRPRNNREIPRSGS